MPGRMERQKEWSNRQWNDRGNGLMETRQDSGEKNGRARLLKRMEWLKWQCEDVQVCINRWCTWTWLHPPWGWPCPLSAGSHQLQSHEEIQLLSWVISLYILKTIKHLAKSLSSISCFPCTSADMLLFCHMSAKVRVHIRILQLLPQFHNCKITMKDKLV